MKTVRVSFAVCVLVLAQGCHSQRTPQHAELSQVSRDEMALVASALMAIKSTGDDLAYAELHVGELQPNFIPDPVIVREGNGFGEAERHRALEKVVRELQERALELRRRTREIDLSVHRDREDAFK